MNKVVSIIISAVVILFCAQPACGQKKEISQAKSYIKSGSDLDKAESLMTGLLKDSANRSNIKIYALWFQAVKGQYEAANEKLYLKQKYDTAAFYNLARRLQQVAFSLDSLDVRPDHKGRVRPVFRKDNAAMLHPGRPEMAEISSFVYGTPVSGTFVS